MTKFDTLYKKIINENTNDEKADPQIEKALSFLPSLKSRIDDLYENGQDKKTLDDKKEDIKQLAKEYEKDLIGFWKLVDELPDEQVYALAKQAVSLCGGKQIYFKLCLGQTSLQLDSTRGFVVRLFNKLNQIGRDKRANVKVTFFPDYKGWTSSLDNKDMFADLRNYSDSCYDKDGNYVKDIDFEAVKAIVNKYAKNADVEVFVDTGNPTQKELKD